MGHGCAILEFSREHVSCSVAHVSKTPGLSCYVTLEEREDGQGGENSAMVGLGKT